MTWVLLRRVVCNALLLSMCGWSFAGHYRIDYSSAGAVRYGNGVTQPYSLSSGNYGGQGTTSGRIDCSGGIGVTFTFVADPNIPQDSPPPSVILRESASATWEGYYGYCSDGWGDTEVSHPPSGSTPGGGSVGRVRYQIINNPGAFFTTVCSPAASAVSSASDMTSSQVRKRGQASAVGGGGGQPPPNYPCTATVWYSAEVYCPHIFLFNMTHSTNAQNILAGQYTTATLLWDTSTAANTSLPAAVGVGNFRWAAEGRTFTNWDATVDRAILAQSTDWSAPTPSWMWISGLADPITNSELLPGPHDARVGCTVDITAQSVALGSIQANSYLAEVWRPVSTCVAKPGSSKWDQNSSGVTDPNAGIHARGAGMSVQTTIGTQRMFVSGSDTGLAGFAQLDYQDCGWTLGIAHLFFSDINNEYQLDTTPSDTTWNYRPIEAALLQDNGTGGKFALNDDPGLIFGAQIQNFNLNYNLKSYFMYKPPGITSQYVPISLVEWSYHAAQGSQPFSTTPPGAVTTGYVGEFWMHPTWNARHVRITGGSNMNLQQKILVVATLTGVSAAALFPLINPGTARSKGLTKNTQDNLNNNAILIREIRAAIAARDSKTLDQLTDKYFKDSSAYDPGFLLELAAYYRSEAQFTQALSCVDKVLIPPGGVFSTFSASGRVMALWLEIAEHVPGAPIQERLTSWKKQAHSWLPADSMGKGMSDFAAVEFVAGEEAVGSNDPKGALDHFDLANRLSPDVPAILFRRGQSKASLGDVSSKDDLVRAIRLAPPKEVGKLTKAAHLSRGDLNKLP